jgi:ribosomal protein S18 acetylase RimI-like enzyme
LGREALLVSHVVDIRLALKFDLLAMRCSVLVVIRYIRPWQSKEEHCHDHLIVINNYVPTPKSAAEPCNENSEPFRSSEDLTYHIPTQLLNMPASEEAVTISPVRSEEDLQAIIILFKAYAQALGIDLTFQDFTTELSNLPGKYAPPTGALLLARASSSGTAVGCVGLRPLPIDGTCEMKRLYVDPKGRGLGLGRKLAREIILEAKRLGYRAMLLDTLRSLEAALGLYKSLGFVEVEAYYDTPLEDTVFLRLDLEKA